MNIIWPETGADFLLLLRDTLFFYNFKFALAIYVIILSLLYQQLLQFIWTENCVLKYSISEGFYTNTREVQDFE